MKNSEMANLLNDDLKNEYKHMHFYMHSSFVVGGLHRSEMQEFLWEEAQSEMSHVQQFADKIVGLGLTPTTIVNDFPTHYVDPNDILRYAIDMEMEVLQNYVIRHEQAATMEDGVCKIDITTFLEDQINSSKADLDNMKKMVN